MAESEFASLIKPWIAKPYDQLSPEIHTIVWQWLPQRQDPRYLLPPRRFVSLWDDLDEKDRLKAARNKDLAFELGYRKPPEGSWDIDAKLIDIYAWEISRFGIVGRYGIVEKNARTMDPTNDGGEGLVPEIPAWLSPMEFAAYAATNNPWLVARCAPDGSGCQLDHLELRAIHFRSLSPTKVLEKAVDMLLAGKIVMNALRDGARCKMPAEDWRYWIIITSPVVENALVVCDVERREPVAGWTNFLISREHADLVRVALLGLREAPGSGCRSPYRRQLAQGRMKWLPPGHRGPASRGRKLESRWAAIISFCHRPVLKSSAAIGGHCISIAQPTRCCFSGVTPPPKG